MQAMLESDFDKAVKRLKDMKDDTNDEEEPYKTSCFTS